MFSCTRIPHFFKDLYDSNFFFYLTSKIFTWDKLIGTKTFSIFHMTEVAARLKKIRKQFLTSIKVSSDSKMETKDSP